MLDEEIGKIRWKACVVDEAHRLKNNTSKLSVFMRQCNIEHHILLTGTPIQNNMRELFNLLNFVDPNAFRSFDDFSEEYGDDKITSDKKVTDLQLVLEPYFLRRLKEDVAKFIPRKQETIIEVELTRIQVWIIFIFVFLFCLLFVFFLILRNNIIEQFLKRTVSSCIEV